MSGAGTSREFTSLIALAALVSLPVLAHAGTLTYTIDTPLERMTVEESAEGALVVVDAMGYEQSSDPGAPRVPVRVVRVVLPQGQSVEEVRFDRGEGVVVARDVDVAIAGERVDENGVVGRGATLFEPVSEAGPFPQSGGRYLGTGYLHGYAIASFAVYPVQIGGDGDVVAYDAVRIEVRTGDDGRGTEWVRRYREGFRERVRSEVSGLVINDEALAGYAFSEVKVPAVRGFAPTAYPSLEGSPVDYVIVTPDSLAGSYQALADWKTDKGVPTVVRTTEWIQANVRNGVDLQETIRNFIIDAYEKWGIRYVLLGGDTEQLPARFLFSDFHGVDGRALPNDYYYSGLDGSWNADHDEVFGEHTVDAPDLYVEVYAGRLPTQTPAEVALLTSKVIVYETPFDRDYANRVVFAAEVLDPKPWDGVEPIGLNGAGIADYIYLSHFQDPDLDVVRMYQTDWLFDGAVPESRQAVLDSLDSGFSHVIHVGHGFRFNMSVGDASIVQSDADALTNGGRLFNLYMQNCTAAAFDYQCLAESFLRNPNGGAVSTIGANEGTFPSAATYYMREYYRLMMGEDVVRLGDAFHRSRLPRTALALISDNIDFWTHYVYTMLGDPEMPLWTGPVDVLQVSHTAGVGLGTTNVTVTVLDGDGLPVDSARVCLSKGTDDYQVGDTDGAGQVTLSFRAESAGTIKVVATGRNHARHESSITVTGGGGAYVSYAGMTVDDDGLGGTVGNGDGVIDAGETVDVVVSVENTGGSASGNVSLVLRSETGGVTVTDSTAGVGVVGASATEAAGDAFRVAFSSGMNDEAVAAFDLIVKDDGVETWVDEIKREVHAPELSQVRLRVDDTATGNGDGVVDSGESFRLYYEMKNFGTGESPALTAEITDLDDGFVFSDSVDSYAPLGSIASGENVVGFLLEETTTATASRLQFTATDTYGRAYVDTLELRAPSPPDTVVLDPSLSPTQLRVTWSASDSADASHYNVYRSSSPGGPYTKSNVDPVEHTVFVERGLSPTTTYYYVVTAVDESGNESVVSVEYSGSTNPGQQTGFPIAMAVETTSSPAVGDIDGDGDLEIVQGNDYVYAWHHDGIELLDGDGDPQSWGILSTRGQSYVSPIALARIDGQPGLDIIAASRDTREVYVFTHAGDTLSNWPQPVENTIRAGIAVGDLDNDNLLEIIAIDEKGVLYAWNHDGSEYIDGDSNPSTPGVFDRLPGCNLNYSTPALADLDGDGDDEIILGTEGNFVYAFDDDGSDMPGWPVALTGDVSGSVAVGDIDNDGDLEVVYHEFGGTIEARHHDGSLMWTSWITNEKFFAPSPALGDVDNDGMLEMFLASSDRKLYGFNETGVGLTGWPVEYSPLTDTESSPIIVDIDGDGGLDIVLGDESQLIDGWSATGTAIDGFPLKTIDAMRGVPAAADLDLDGDVELVAAGWDKNIYAWDFPGAYDPDTAPWAQFHANAHNDGLVGSVIPTGIMDVAFAFDVGAAAVSLSWYLPPQAGYLQDVYRARATREGGSGGAFERMATGVGVDEDGRLQYVDTRVEPGVSYVYRIAESGGEVLHETPVIYVPVSRAGMEQNHPNPFNPATRITYRVPEGPAQRVELVVYDVRGARVRTLVSGSVRGGRHEVTWDGRDDAGTRVSSGVYFYRMVQRNSTATRKMLLLK